MLVTAQQIEEAARNGLTQVDFPAGAVITPGAADRARDLGLSILRGGQPFGPPGRSALATTGTRAPATRAWPPHYPEIGSDWRRNATVVPSAIDPAQQQLVDWDRVRSVMQKHGLDGIVAAVPHNVYYLSGLDTEPLWEFPWMSQVVVPLHGEPALILSQLDLIAPVEMKLWVEDIFPYGRGEMVVWDAGSLLETEQRLAELKGRVEPRLASSNFEAIVKALRDRGILSGRLGVDDVRIVDRLPERINAVDAIEIMREIRMIKTEPEIALMRDAAITNEAAALAAAARIPTSSSWQEVVNTYRSEMALRNAEARYLIGGSQHHTGTHQHIYDYAPRRGDFFMVDALGTKRHYYGDFGRTVSWGEPSPLIRRRFEAMRRGFEAGLAFIRPGRPFAEVNEYVREVIRREGNEHHRVTVTHSVGLEHTDVPRRADNVVQANMTMNIDIAYLEAGFGALHLEDTFVVRPDGTDMLTSGRTDMIVIG